MFVGGTNATHHALRNYSPQMSGFNRLFMVRTPLVIAKMFAGESDNMYSSQSLFMQFKHALEYMNRSVEGFGDTSLQVASTPIQGGFAGRKFNTPTVTKNDTETITISLYEMNGSPVYTVVRDWMNAIGDENGGLSHYGGWISAGKDDKDTEQRMFYLKDQDTTGIAYNEANHTCEFIYVLTDRSGLQVERAVLLADCFPTQINSSAALNMGEGGVHDNIVYNIQFNAVCYSSPIINAIANDLLKQYRIVSNSLNFNPELGDAVYGDNNAGSFQRSLGSIPVDSATGTNIGNIPVYTTTNSPADRSAERIPTLAPREVELKSMVSGQIAGRDGATVVENWDGFANE
jgi:hypothetical protein